MSEEQRDDKKDDDAEWLRWQADMFMAGDDKFANRLLHIAERLSVPSAELPIMWYRCGSHGARESWGEKRPDGDGWTPLYSAPQSATLRREGVLEEVIARLTKIQRMEVRGSERHALCEYMVQAVRAMNATDSGATPA